MARARHESREPQPRRVYTTYTAAGNAAFRGSLLTSRSRTSEGEGSTAPFHQVDFPASRDNRGRYPHAQGSGEARAQVISRGNLPNRPQPDRHVGDHYSATSSHSNSRETFRPSRPLESSPHSRHRSHDPHQRPRSRLDLSTVAGDFPESPRVLGDYRRVQNTSSESREEVKNDEVSVFSIMLYV